MNIKKIVLSTLLFGFIVGHFNLSASDPIIELNNEDEKFIAKVSLAAAGGVIGVIVWVAVAEKLNKLQKTLEKLEKIEESQKQKDFELDEEMLLILDYLKENHSEFFEKYFGGEGKGDVRFISALSSGVLAGVISGLLINKLIFN